MASRAESNTGHIGRRRGLSPLHQPLSSLSAIWAKAPSSYCFENSIKQYGYVKFLLVLASSLILGRSSNVRVILFFGVSRFFLLLTITRGNSTRKGLNRWLIQPFFLSEDLSFSLLSGWRGLRNSPGRLLALWKSYHRASAMIMETARKTSFENKNLRNCDYFKIIPICSHFTIMAKNATTGLVSLSAKLN